MKKKVEAAQILNNLLAELVVSTRMFSLFDIFIKVGKVDQMTTSAFNSTNFNSVVLALCKWLELYRKYNRYFPAELRDENKAIYRRLDSLNIQTFRNTYVGHVVSKYTKSPLNPEEVNEYYEKITGGDLNNFLQWVNNPGDETCVVGVLERTRDQLNESVQESHTL